LLLTLPCAHRHVSILEYAHYDCNT
jgi:hypothetical protein